MSFHQEFFSFKAQRNFLKESSCLVISFLSLLIAVFSGLTANASVIKEYEAHHLFPYPTADASLTTAPAKPDLESPAFFEHVGGTVTLKWKAVDSATGYHVQVATDPNFKWLVLEDKHLQATSLDVPNLEPGLHYHWRVLAVKNTNDASYMKSAWNRSMFSTEK